MRIFQRVLLASALMLLCGHAASAQTSETFSAGSGGAYDASVCNDPSIASMAAQQNAVPYHDPNWNTPGDPLKASLDYLAQKYDNNHINRAGACEHAPGVVYMVPKNLVGEVTQLIGEIEATQPGGDAFNGSADKNSSGQPGGKPSTGTNGGPTGSNGGPLASGTSTNPCEPNYDMSTPAGRAAAAQMAAQTKQACDEFRCQHNPQLSICTTVVVQPPPCTPSATVACKQGTGKPLTAKADNTPCAFSAENLGIQYWNADDLKNIQMAVKDAKAMLAKAKSKVAKIPWSDATEKISMQWFGSGGAATQEQMQKRINGAINLLNGMTIETQFRPGSDKECNKGIIPAAAYIELSAASDPFAVIYLCPLFWYQGTSGPDSMAATIVHELSHYDLAGGTKDVTYTQPACTVLAFSAKVVNPAGEAAAEAAAQAAHMVGAPKAATAVLDAKQAVSAAPLTNADSFEYFVYDLSQ
jgi:hypothetical protein